jgi:hypothetical protein
MSLSFLAIKKIHNSKKKGDDLNKFALRGVIVWKMTKNLS